MKKSIKISTNIQETAKSTVENYPDLNIENQEIEYVEGSEDTTGSDSEECSNFSFSSIICAGFIIMLIIAITYKFIFPSINSMEANLTHKKIGKSIVCSFFNLLENTKYSEAVKLLDVSNSQYSVDSLIDNLKNQFGSTDIVGCNVMNVIENQDSSVVNAIVSYIDSTGQVLKKDQSFLVKNTPQGWKISLNGLIKKFKLQPTSAVFFNSFRVTLEEMEYCVEGINLKIRIENNTYKNFNIKGIVDMNMTTGLSFSQPIESILKSKVCYNHNILFNSSSGEPSEIVLKLEGDRYGDRKLPVKIIR